MHYHAWYRIILPLHRYYNTKATNQQHQNFLFLFFDKCDILQKIKDRHFKTQHEFNEIGSN